MNRNQKWIGTHVWVIISLKSTFSSQKVNKALRPLLRSFYTQEIFIFILLLFILSFLLSLLLLLLFF